MTTPDAEYLYRFGIEPECAGALEAACEAALARGFLHGVSVRSETARVDASVASRAELELYFRIEQTGRSPLHFAVELPHPVAEDIAHRYDASFGRESKVSDG